jgi:putative ABC transport system permease protein
MLKNYLKITYRNLWRHKGFSFINIMGLAVSMAACFLIFSYVRFELSYDQFNEKADRIYRIVTDIRTPTETLHPNGPSWAVPPNLKDEFPEIESFVRLNYASLLVKKGNIQFQEDKTLMADSSFFSIFDLKLLSGNPKTALSKPFSMVLSESAAKKYFGTANPIGQTLSVTENSFQLTVTGVMQDIPQNSTVQADMIFSMSTLTQELNKGLDNAWGSYGITAYLLLKSGTNATALQAKFPAFLEKRNGEEIRKMQMFPTLILEPLRDIYLYSTRDGSKTAQINNVYIFTLVAIFILLIACINFINLTTARSVDRAKEVGIRKVVGAGKQQIARQFLGESILLCLIAFVLSIILIASFIPAFNQLSGKIISMGFFSDWKNPASLFIAAIVIGFLAGIYPSFVLSSFQPVMVLKGRFATGTKGLLLRRGLVIFQFTISIALIIGTIVIYTQMQFMRNKNLGFNKEQMLVIDSYGDKARQALIDYLKTIPQVKSVAQSSSVPGGGNPGAYSEIENSKGELQIANLDLYFVDFNYIPHYNIKLVAGRAFSKDFGTDTTQAMLINETALKLFGYSSPEQAIGKRFKQWGREGQIIGVMKDFHFQSLQQAIKPLTMRIENNQINLLSVNLSGQNIPATIAGIEQKWKELIPGRPMSYYFLDEFYDRQYRNEQRFEKLFLDFAILAIFISCLGLLGLASYSTMQRTKEIGIRKVLGASVSNIVNLLSVDFLKLVLLSFVIAIPIAGLFMHNWLADFAYRTSLHWWIFLLAGILAIAIALFTVSFQAVKAAITNPIKSLRSE